MLLILKVVITIDIQEAQQYGQSFDQVRNAFVFIVLLMLRSNRNQFVMTWQKNTFLRQH